MRKTIAVVALLLLPATVMAQGRGQRRPGREQIQRNVFERVLQHKADLALSTEQISKLEGLSKQLTEEQKPIVDELRKQRETGVRDLTEEQREAARKNMEKLRAQREEALAQLKNVLNDEQQAKVKSLLEEGRARRRGERPARR